MPIPHIAHNNDATIQQDGKHLRLTGQNGQVYNVTITHLSANDKNNITAFAQFLLKELGQVHLGEQKIYFSKQQEKITWHNHPPKESLTTYNETTGKIETLAKHYVQRMHKKNPSFAPDAIDYEEHLKWRFEEVEAAVTDPFFTAEEQQALLPLYEQRKRTYRWAQLAHDTQNVTKTRAQILQELYAQRRDIEKANGGTILWAGGYNNESGIGHTVGFALQYIDEKWILTLCEREHFLEEQFRTTDGSISFEVGDPWEHWMTRFLEIDSDGTREDLKNVCMPLTPHPPLLPPLQPQTGNTCTEASIAPLERLILDKPLRKKLRRFCVQRVENRLNNLTKANDYDPLYVEKFRTLLAEKKSTLKE